MSLHARGQPKGVSSAIDELLGNAAAHPASRGASARSGSKRVAIVTCMDARIDPVRIFALADGDAYVLRNAGGLVTDDVLRSLVLSQRRLGTREVLLMHHTKCGLLGADEPALRDEIVAETGDAPPYAFGAFADVDEAVRTAIAAVRGHSFLPHRDRVRGCVYDVDTRHVREVIA